MCRALQCAAATADAQRLRHRGAGWHRECLSSGGHWGVEGHFGIKPEVYQIIGLTEYLSVDG
jgi:hypothetical protein